jgi:hypothetical protein
MADPLLVADSGNDKPVQNHREWHPLGDSMNVSLFTELADYDFQRGAHWYHECPFLPCDWETTNAVGAGTLKHAAMRRFMLDQSSLRPEHFECIPFYLAKYLWECMYRW